MSSIVTLNSLRRHLAAALLVALVALALPHPASAQPILRGKMQQAGPARSSWQPVRAAFAGPGHSVMPSVWAAAHQQAPLTISVLSPATNLAPQPPPRWLPLLLP